MKQKLLLLRLAFIMAGMFLTDFYKRSKMEIADKKLHPQENYSNCLERATDIVMKSMDRALTFYALAIADHRMCSHGDNEVVGEMKELSEGLTVNEQKATTRGWWLA